MQTRLSVLLLESGGLEFATETQELYEGSVVGHAFTPLTVDRLRYFGGTTNHWFGSCCPFHPIDLEGWPFGRDVLDPFYRQAQAICQLGPFTYEPEAWETKEARPLALAQGSRILTGVFQYSPPTRFGQVYRGEIATTGVQCCLNANVVDIDTNDSGREVTGLRAATLSGNAFRVTARFYVLAAGGIENARLLLNANKVQRQGIGNGYDLVGRYFMDHADIFGAGTIVFDGDSAGRFYVEGSDKVPGLTAQGYLFLAPDVREREGLPSACIALQKGLPVRDFFAQSSLKSIYLDLKAGHLPDHLAFDVKQIIGRAEEKITRSYDRLFHSPSSFYSTLYSCGPPARPR